jgi:Amt family ammonium transporter
MEQESGSNSGLDVTDREESLTGSGDCSPEHGRVRGLEAAFETLPAMAMLVRSGRIILRNALSRRLSGFPGDLLPAAMRNQMQAAALEDCEAVDHALIGACDISRGEYRCRFDCLMARRHGPPMQVNVVSQEAEFEGQPCRLLLMLERAEGLAGASGSDGSFTEDVLDAMADATAITHDGRVLYVNRQFSHLFGYSVVECVGEELDTLLMPQGRLYENEIIYHQLRQEGRAKMETGRRNRSGEEIAVWMLAVPVRLGGEAHGLMVSFRDIRRQQNEAQKLVHNALHDSLTGLPNRALFLDRIQLTLARLRRRPDRPFAVIFVDLDGFKKVNDTMGHRAGDALLQEIAERLSSCLRPQDTVARLGGDEFALLLDECGSAFEVGQVADRIQKVVCEPFSVEGGVANVSASMGISIVDTASLLAEEILADADAGMYRAKTSGKGRYHLREEIEVRPAIKAKDKDVGC